MMTLLSATSARPNSQQFVESITADNAGVFSARNVVTLRLVSFFYEEFTYSLLALILLDSLPVLERFFLLLFGPTALHSAVSNRRYHRPSEKTKTGMGTY